MPDPKVLVIAVFEVIYTGIHHKKGGWRRRFATSAAELEAVECKRRKRDEELAGARRQLSDGGWSSETGKHERECAPTLSYGRTNQPV